MRRGRRQRRRFQLAELPGKGGSQLPEGAEASQEERSRGNVVPFLSLEGIVLRGGDFAMVDWRDFVLEGADLRGSDLRGADLRGASLRGANLREATLSLDDLRGADLGCADLRGAPLREADLRGASLRWANLHGADLTGAQLEGADLQGAELGRAFWPRKQRASFPTNHRMFCFCGSGPTSVPSPTLSRFLWTLEQGL